MATSSLTLRVLLLALGALACAHCGGVAAPEGVLSDGGVADGSVLPDGAPVPGPGPTCNGGGGTPTSHRAVATACSAPSPADLDAGLMAACTVDTDCPSGNTCECADQIGGNARHSNTCLPTGCLVDADCGAGNYCSPSTNSRCGGLTGYYCHKPSDCCTNDSDCGTGNACNYDPTAGHWLCAAVVVCNG